MELRQIQCFLAASRTLNFAKAAEHCNVSRPALTRAIQKMENEFGQLFSREHGDTQLTALGRLLQPQFAQMLESAQAAKEAVARLLRLDDAQLTLGVMGTIGPLYLAGFLNRFRATQGELGLTLVEGVPTRLSDLLIRGELDVAVMASPHGFQRSLRAQPLYDERFVIVCAPGHHFAGNKVVRLSEMDGQSYLERVNCEYRDCLAELLARRNVRILRTYASEREDWLQIMVLAGMGVCLLPEFSAMLPGLVIRPVIDPSISRRVCLVTVADRCWSSPVAALISALRHYEWPSSRIELFHNEGSGA